MSADPRAAPGPALRPARGERAPLPLVLVAAMLVVGAGLELALDGRLDAATKAPLALLLALAFARARRGGSAR